MPEAEPAVGEWRLLHTLDGKAGVPAHVTILYPFVPAGELDDVLLAELRELSGRHEVFDFVLQRVARWPEGIVYLPPEPSRPFVELTEAVVARWPGYPPYGGIHDEVIPHLTVVHDEAVADEAVRAVESALPIECEARELTLLVEGEDGRWSPYGTLLFAVRQQE